MRPAVLLALVLLAVIAPATCQRPWRRGQSNKRLQKNQKPAEQMRQMESEEDEVEETDQAAAQQIKAKPDMAQVRQQWDLAAAQAQAGGGQFGASFSSSATTGMTGSRTESSEGAQERYEQEQEAAEERAERAQEMQEREAEMAQEMRERDTEMAQEMREQEAEMAAELAELNEERQEQEQEAAQAMQEREAEAAAEEAENAQEMQQDEAEAAEEAENEAQESEYEGEAEVEESEGSEGAEEGEGAEAGEAAEGGEGGAGTGGGGGGAGGAGSTFSIQQSVFSSVGAGNAQSVFAGPNGGSFFDPYPGGSTGMGSSAYGGNQGQAGGSNNPAFGGGNGATGAATGATGGTNGAMSGANGATGGTNGTMGGTNGTMGGTNGASGANGTTGGANGVPGGALGTLGGSNGTAGGTNASTEATGGKPGGATGVTGTVNAPQGETPSASFAVDGFGPSAGSSFYDTTNLNAQNEPNIAFAPAPIIQAETVPTETPLTPAETAAVDREYMDQHLCGGFLGANGISGMKDLAVVALDYAGKDQTLQPCNVPTNGRTTRRQAINIGFRSAMESRGQDTAAAVLRDLPGMIQRYRQTPSKVHVFSWFTPSEHALRNLLAKKQRGGLTNTDVALGYVEESKLARFSALLGDTTFTNLLAELQQAGISVQRLCGSCQQIANMTKWQRARQGLVNGVGVFDQQSGQCGPVPEVNATEQLALGQPQCQNFQETMGACLFSKLAQACPWLRHAQAASEQPLSAIMEAWAEECGKNVACWRGKGSYLSLLARTAASCRVSAHGASGAIAQCVGTGMNAPLDPAPTPAQPAL